MLHNITIARVLTQWIVSSVGLVIVVILLPGAAITNWQSAFVTSAFIGLVNTLLWPLFIRFALPFAVVTLGLASLILNGFIIALAASIVPGFTIATFWTAIGVTIGLTIVTTVTNQLLVINDDETYYRNVIKRQAKKKLSKKDTKTPGVLFLQIDGLSYSVFQRALRDGNIPGLAKWLRNGTYRVEPWETDWSSQTGASQAGILMGSNKDVPAFRWYEKDTGETLMFGNPGHLTKLEKRFSNKDGLLANDGASRGNLFSGDAEFTMLTLSTVKSPNRKAFGEDYYAYFANPYNFTRTLVLMISEVIREIRGAAEQKKRDVLPRLDHKEKLYPLVRAWTTVIQRDIVVQTLISDMYRGRSVLYADFVGYDEVSHHSGVERHEALSVLRDIDEQFSRLAAAANDAPKPYHLVILSDHGQTQGATFYQRTGYKLETLIQHLTNKSVSAETDNHEDLNYFNAALTEATQSKGMVSRMLARVTKRYRKENETEPSFDKEINVMASGCLGLVYFKKYPYRVSLEEISKAYPHLIPGLLANPYIGFLLVNSQKHGGLALGKNGTYYLETDRVEGENPLLPFGENTARHVKRTHYSKYVADIMINSFYDITMDEVASFEEFVGSHGGLGGNQSRPFILFPKEWHFPNDPVIGAENVHKVMKQWLQDLENTSTDHPVTQQTGKSTHHNGNGYTSHIPAM